jgi:cell division septum initiation protein DivIVA
MSATQPAEHDAVERAEELVDRMTHQVGTFATRVFARAREEAEDIWAEARAASRGARDGSQD